MRLALPLILMPFAVAVAGCGSMPPATPPAPDAPAGGWQLVWADEFDAQRLDQGAWTSVVMPDPYNDELQYYPGRIDDAPGSNAWLEDGVLIIEAREENYEHRKYTSARLNTKGKKEFLYGRFEARIRIPDGAAMWPAFWLLGGNIDSVPWPACGEIDIMEAKGRLPNWTSGAIHHGPDADGRITFENVAERAGADLQGFVKAVAAGDIDNLHDAWHVFAVEWEADQIRWYLDDVLFETVDKADHDDPGYWPFDDGHTFFIILNLAVGGLFDDYRVPPPGMAPQRLYVDYVRVWQQSPGN